MFRGPRRHPRMQAALRAALIPTLTPTPTPTLALTLTLTPTPTLTLTLTLTRRYVHLISTHLGEGGREGGGKGGKDLHGKGGKEGAPVEALGFRAACAALSPEARAAAAETRPPCTMYYLPLTICGASTCSPSF